MKQSILRVFLLLCLVSCYLCLHDVIDLSGWKSIPLDSKEATDSMLEAAKHIGGKFKKPVTAFKWLDKVSSWDLYRVSFQAVFPDGILRECHSDVLFNKNPASVTVFNSGCLPADKVYA